jgi:hypothetical protein
MATEIDALPTSKSIGWTDALLTRLGAGSIGTASRFTVSVNGAASAPPVAITGTIYTGGTATTTKPQLLIEPTGTTSTGWSTAGTLIGANAASGFTGNLIDLQVAGAWKFRVSPDGNITCGQVSASTVFCTSVRPNSLILGGLTDIFLERDAANTLALRNGANAQTFNVYGTYTSGSVYERGAVYADSNGFNIAHQQLGATKRPVRILGHNLASAEAVSALEINQTWNTTGNPVALKMAITNTASGATSKFLSFLAGASGTTEVFSVDKFGVVKALVQSGTVGFAVGDNCSVNVYGMSMRVDSQLEWSSSSVYTGPKDLIVLRDAANTLALRNSTNAQAFNIYGTYTSASVYERMFARYSAANSVYEIGTEQSGASSRLINLSQVLMIGGQLSGSAGGRIRFEDPKVILGRGDGAFAATFEFGSTSSTRHLTMNSDFRIRWGTSSSEPALKRSTTVVQARLADDSAFASFQGKLTTDTAYAAGDPTTTGYIILYDSTGTAYRVPALLHS